MISRYAHLAAGLLAITNSSAGAQATPAAPLPFLSPLFAHNMVLQRGKPNTIWGWSDPGDTIRVQSAAILSPESPEPTDAGR